MAGINQELKRIFFAHPLPREDRSEGYNVILMVYDKVVADTDVLRIAQKSLKRFRRHFTSEAANQIVCLAIWQALRKHDFTLNRKFTCSVYKWVEFICLRELRLARRLIGSTGHRLDALTDDNDPFKEVEDADEVAFIEVALRPPELNLLRLTSVDGCTNRDVGKLTGKSERQISKQRSTVIGKARKILSKGTPK